MKNSNKGFSIIEILVGIFIFSVGLTSVFVLIISTGNMNAYSKNSIIASNLAREGIEIVKNVRDDNYLNLYRWNKIPGEDNMKLFSTGVYYKVENNLIDKNKIALFNEIENFGEGKDNLSTKMNNYNLYLTPDGYYTYDSNNNKKTIFYRYIKFDDVKYSTGGTTVVIPGSLKMTSNVIWYEKGYHEVRLDTIISDWQRQ